MNEDGRWIGEDKYLDRGLGVGIDMIFSGMSLVQPPDGGYLPVELIAIL